MARRPSGGLKSRFVVTYETFFRGESPPDAAGANFWNELFLLKVHSDFLEKCVLLASEEHLLRIKSSLHVIFHRALLALRDENQFRMAHALETLSVLLKAIFRKKFANFSTDVVDLICGLPNADPFFRELLDTTRKLLVSTPVRPLRESALQLLVVIATATDNVNQNAILQYFMLENVFPTLLGILCADVLDPPLTFDAAFLLLVLLNYKKHEMLNPYVQQLGDLNDPKLWPRFCILISSVLTQQNAIFSQQIASPASRSRSLLATYVWGSGSDSAFRGSSSSSDLGNVTALFLLYQLLQLNKHFFGFFTDPHAPATASDAKQPPQVELLTALLTFASFSFLHLASSIASQVAKLCLIVILSLAEHPVANHLLHDAKITAPVVVFSKKGDQETGTVHRNEPLASVVLDLLVEMMRSSMKKNINAELYGKALWVLHALLCHEKKFRVHVPYHWKELWAALFTLMKFLAVEDVIKRPEMRSLAAKLTTILNFFITYGDTFLSSSSDYDDLYYEIMRLRQTVEQFCIRASEQDSGLSMSLENIKMILSHFSGKIDHWALTNPDRPLTSHQVISIINSNYVSLKLQLLDGLDFVEPYLENPKEVPFFSQVVRNMVLEYRPHLGVISIPDEALAKRA